MVKYSNAFILTIASILSFTFASLCNATDKSPLVFGSVAQDRPSVMYKRLGPLTSYLSKILNRPVKLQLSPNMGDAINKITTNKVDITYLTPVAYIRAHEKGNSHIIAKMLTNNRSSFQLMIVVRTNSKIKTVAQLAGKSFAFGDKKALLQRATVTGSGMPLKKLGSYKFIGHYDNIASSIYRGDFDAGILKDTTALQWVKKGLRIIYSSPHMPPYNITASNKLDVGTLTDIRNAFLQLNIKNPEHRKAIKSLDVNYDGFVKSSDTEYDVVRRLIKPFDTANEK